MKRFGPFTEPPDSENSKVAVLIAFPKISSSKSVKTKFDAFRQSSRNRHKSSKMLFGSDVMQSGFGVNLLFWSGEF